MLIDLRAELRVKPNSSITRRSAFQQGLRAPWRQPLLSLLTLAMLTIVLCSLALVQVLQKNLQLFSQQFFREHRLVLFLKVGLSPERRQHLIQTLRQRFEVAELRYISPSEGLEQLANKLQLSDMLGQLADNPLPGVIELLANTQGLSLAQLTTFLAELEILPEVAHTQFDLALIKNIYAKLNFWQNTFCYSLVFLASIGVILMTNSLLLTWRNNLAALFYTGVFYGLLCGLLACAVLAVLAPDLIQFLSLLFGAVSIHWPDAIYPYICMESTLIGFVTALLAAGLTIIYS